MTWQDEQHTSSSNTVGRATAAEATTASTRSTTSSATTRATATASSSERRHFNEVGSKRREKKVFGIEFERRLNAKSGIQPRKVSREELLACGKYRWQEIDSKGWSCLCNWVCQTRLISERLGEKKKFLKLFARSFSLQPPLWP